MAKPEHYLTMVVLILILVTGVTLFWNYSSVTGLVINNEGQIPPSFGAPFNVFSGQQILSASYVNGKLTITAVADQVSKSGFFGGLNQWTPFTFTGQDDPSDNRFIRGTARAEISANLPSGTNYIIAYACSLVNGVMKCGCRNQNDCDKWQIQSFDVGAGSVCTDSDQDATYFDGINPNKFGAVTDKFGNQQSDTCITGSPNKVNEWKCNSDGTSSSLQVTCPQGQCSSGACSLQQPSGPCGNGILDSNEECDPGGNGKAAIIPRTCVQDGYLGGSYSCTGCSLDGKTCQQDPKMDTCYTLLIDQSRLGYIKCQTQCESMSAACMIQLNKPSELPFVTINNIALNCKVNRAAEISRCYNTACGSEPPHNKDHLGNDIGWKGKELVSTCRNSLIAGSKTNFPFVISETSYVMKEDRPFRPAKDMSMGPVYIAHGIESGDTISFYGKITDESGTPLAGVKVYASELSPVDPTKDSKAHITTAIRDQPGIDKSSCVPLGDRTILYDCLMNLPAISCSAAKPCKTGCSCTGGLCAGDVIDITNVNCQSTLSYLYFQGEPRGKLLIGQTDENGNIVFDQVFVAYLASRYLKDTASMKVLNGGKQVQVHTELSNTLIFSGNIRISKGQKSALVSAVYGESPGGIHDLNMDLKCNLDASRCTQNIKKKEVTEGGLNGCDRCPANGDFALPTISVPRSGGRASLLNGEPNRLCDCMEVVFADFYMGSAGRYPIIIDADGPYIMTPPIPSDFEDYGNKLYYIFWGGGGIQTDFSGWIIDG